MADDYHLLWKHHWT